MAKKAAEPVEDAGTASEGPDGEVFEAAPYEERKPAQTFEGAYADYFSSVCRGQRAQQVEMQRVYADYVMAMQAAMAVHDGFAALRAQKLFEQEWARVSDPARFQESVRDAFADYQQKISHAFAATDLTRLAPGALEAVGRSVSYVAAHRMGVGG